MKSIPKTIRLMLITLAGLALIAIGATTSPRRAGQPTSVTQASLPAQQQKSAPVVGAPAPDFELRTVDGQTLRLRELRGQAVLLNFWATWCGPCRSEMPTIQAVYDQQREKGFTVVAINMREDPGRVRAFFAEHQLSFPAALDPDGSVAQMYEVFNIPTSYFIDRQGIIRARYFGPMSRSVMIASLEALR